MEIDDHVAHRLREDAIVLLSTVRSDGRPVTVPVWFVWEDDTITIYAPSTTGKVRNVGANPAVALALDSAGGTDVVLLEGIAALGPAGEAAAATHDAFAAKYGERMGRSPAEWAGMFDRRITVTIRDVRAWLAGTS